MKKRIITGTILLLAIVGKTFAHDCNLVIWNEIDAQVNNYQTNYRWYIKFLPVDAFKQALIHMKAYCCLNTISCTKEEKNNLPTTYPESAYLYDHLIDINMRRLDGYAPLAYGLSPDPTGKERREKINELAEAPNGGTAKEIEDKYVLYRTKKRNDSIPRRYEVILNQYNTDIKTVSLLDKYDNLCNITKILYNKFQQTDNTIIWTTQDSKSYLNACRNIVEKRVKREDKYVKIVMVQKTGKLLDEVTKAHTKKYFAEEKLMKLRNLIVEVKNLFQDMVKQAPVSQTCSS